MIIGIDCATDEKRVGLALARWEAGRASVEQITIGGRGVPVAEIIADWATQDESVLLAMDAPLGWPASLGRSLAIHKAGATLPAGAHALLQKITDTTIAYLKQKVKAGVDAVQIFDSWGGLLSPADYKTFSWPYINQIVDALKDEAPVIVFAKGCWFALKDMAQSHAAALGVDWTCEPYIARYLSGGQITLQGNFDPSRLLSPPDEIKRQVRAMIEGFGKDRYIVNLGHGILPNIPVEHARAFIDAVKSYAE